MGTQPKSNDDAIESFFRVVDKIQERNKHIDPQKIETVVDEAVAEVKANRKEQSTPSTDCP